MDSPQWVSQLVSILSRCSNCLPNGGLWLVSWCMVFIFTTTHIASIFQLWTDLSESQNWLANYHASVIFFSLKQNPALGVGHCLTRCLFIEVVFVERFHCSQEYRQFWASTVPALFRRWAEKGVAECATQHVMQLEHYTNMSEKQKVVHVCQELASHWISSWSITALIMPSLIGPATRGNPYQGLSGWN